ncbi:7484_t:CDS:1 [Scutellospora calospora]|uniref:7484_t:CDS:1 n=1 Tax=Scutellospora calospora TaxID=85575 RepID=A0ACA9KEN1_9GLOM|nr:7484_t:CDS:1 [Scutellospora calospora]
MPYNNYQLNHLQRKALVDLFAHLQHFNDEFLKSNILNHDFLKSNIINNDKLFLRNLKTTAINLGLHYVHQKNVVIGDEIFRKAVKNHKEWYEVNRQWIIFFVILAKKSSIDKCSSYACVSPVEETKKGDDCKKIGFSDSVGKDQTFISKKLKKPLPKVADDQIIKPQKKLDVDKPFVQFQNKKFIKKRSKNL